MSGMGRGSELKRRRDHALVRAKRLVKSVEGLKGVDFGYMYKDGLRTQRRGIRFHVKEKRPLTVLAPSQVVPTEILGVTCDVIEANYAPHAESPRSPFDPVRPGISVGNTQRQTTGTLGIIVYDSQSDAPCMLSNWHVLCGDAKVHAGEEITQPGPRHLGAMPPRTVAQLFKWLNLSSGYDAALARIVPGTAFDSKAFGTNLAPLKIGKPQIGMRLVKTGVTSGVTSAVVDGLDGSYEIDYTPFGDAVRWMDGIRLVPDPEQVGEEISLEGDSGAVWIEPQKRLAVGLHFGGEDGLGPLAEYAVAHPLPRVLELLDVSLTSS
jgi:hypothetical protein